jgi:hypothetical protein
LGVKFDVLLTGFFVHKKISEVQIRVGGFSAFMQQYEELGFLNINLSLGTYLGDFDFDL